MAPSRHVRAAITAASVTLATLYVGSLFPVALMFADTMATGGDLASHNYAASYARALLLGEGRLTGWVPGNYCGFPLFQMYFPLPFVAIVLASTAIAPNVAFKLVSVLGVMALPAASAYLLARLRVPYPGPALAPVFVLPFLFQGGNSMWGGNINSTLAGEFAYSLSLPIALLLFAHYEAALRRSRVALLAAILVAALALTHAYTALWVAAAAGLAALVGGNIRGSIVRFAIVFTAGGALCGFWLLPLVVYSPWTTAFRHIWIINSFTEVIPPPLWPVLGCAVLAPLAIAWSRADVRGHYWRGTALLYAACGVALFAYAIAPNFGVVDVRFLPFMQLSLCLLAAAGCGWIASRLPAAVLTVAAALIGAVLLTQDQQPQIREWIRWNYEGIERKPAWPVYRAIADHVRGSLADPRVAYEHAVEHEAFGTIRAFENLPLLAGRSTLEGVNMQASVTSPFVFFLQSEISRVMSCPFPEWGCSRPDLARGIEHLRMMHATDLILRSDDLKQQAAGLPALTRSGTFGDYSVYRLESDHGYALPLARAPYPVMTPDWKADAYRWFKHARYEDAIPVWLDRPDLASTFSTEIQENAARSSPGGTEPIAETVGAERLDLAGLRAGRPVLIRISFHPRWSSTTGERIWLAGPGFMLVVPRSDRLTLVYGASGVTRAGMALTWIALGLVVAVLVKSRRLDVLWGRMDQRADALPGAGAAGSSSNAWPSRPQVGAAGLALVLVAVAAVRGRLDDADVVYRRGQRHFDSGDWDTARTMFAQARETAPLSNTAVHSTYFTAISFYRQERWREAREVFQDLVRTFPEAPAAPEAAYHVALCTDRIGARAEAIRLMVIVRRDFASSVWSVYAGDRLREWASP